jgi:ribosomal protein S18 acetylase RimI-like enzyme
VTDGGPAVALRPAVAADREFLEALYASTRADEVAPLPWSEDQKRAFLAQQFAAQSAHYAQHYGDASFDVILVDGRRAGRLIVARRESDLKVIDIALLPEHRSRGIGTGLLVSLLDEAVERGVKVEVYVERFNPALALYRRLGFEAVDEDGVYLRMERSPETGQAKIAS